MPKGFSSIRHLPRSEFDAALRDMRRERSTAAQPAALPISQEVQAWADAQERKLKQKLKRRY